MVFLFVFKAGYVLAADVAVIKTESIKPYNEALKGFNSVFSGTVKVYDLEGQVGPGKKIIESVIAQKPDLIYTIGTKASLLAKREITQLPIVFSLVSRPQKHGLKQKNISGVSINVSAEKQFNVFKTILKDKKRLGVIYNPQNTQREIEQAKLAANSLGLKLLAQAVYSYQDVPAALRNLIDKIDCLWLTMDETILTHLTIKHILLFTTRHKIPILGFSPRFIKNGLLFALKTDYFDMGVQAGELAEKILARKTFLPSQIVFPRKTVLIINTKVADFLNIEIDPQILKESILYE